MPEAQPGLQRSDRARLGLTAAGDADLAPLALLVGLGAAQVHDRAGARVLQWQAVVHSHAFNVYRGDANGLDMRLLAAGIASAQKMFVDSAPPVGQTVSYSVAAQNAAGEGPHSPPVRNAATR